LDTIDRLRKKLAHYDRRVIAAGTLTKSAVLIPITKRTEGLELLFTKRTDRVEHHKGQISFPGGACDPAETTPAETALRESQEEIGLPPSAVALLGAMDDIRTPSGFIVTPVVGYIETLPTLHLNDEEVAEVVFVPLEKFFDEGVRRSKFREVEGKTTEVFFYDVWKEPVWGATALFVKRLVDLLRSPEYSS